jgi:DNA-binding GntR family transcriptional regulator
MRQIRKASDLSSRAAEQIRGAILRGDFLPGSRIRQEDLAARLAVSRAPVRQALLMLEMEGLVHIDRSGSAVVAPLDADLIRDLYGFRDGVERYVAENLARQSDLSLAPVRELLVAGRKAAAGGDQTQLIDLDLKFHVALYDALGNRILSDVMRGQWNNMRRVMSATLAIAGYSRQIWDEHTAIVDAITQHDPDRAGSLASAHTRAASTRLLERLGVGTPEPPPTAAAIARENHFGPE